MKLNLDSVHILTISLGVHQNGDFLFLKINNFSEKQNAVRDQRECWINMCPCTVCTVQYKTIRWLWTDLFKKLLNLYKYVFTFFV